MLSLSLTLLLSLPNVFFAVSLSNNSSEVNFAGKIDESNSKECREYPGCDRLMKKWSSQCKNGIYIKKYCPCSCALHLRQDAGVNSFSINGQLKTCCKKRCVNSKCNFLCDYGLKSAQVLSDEGMSCLNEMKDVLFCASSGKADSRECCLQSKVPKQCLIFCTGRMPPVAAVLGVIGCAEEHLNSILSCHEQSAVKRYTERKSQKWMSKSVKKKC